MSGLVAFLNKFLSPQQKQQNISSKSTNALGVVGYHESLASALLVESSSPSPSVQESSFSLSPEGRMLLNNNSNGNSNSNSSSNRDSGGGGGGDIIDDDEATENDRPELLAYDEWRRHCNTVLTEYVYQRYVLEKEDEGDDNGYGYGYGDDDDLMDSSTPDDEPSQDQAPESQAWPGENTTKQEKKQNTPRIPLVQNAEHVTTSISQLDLYTKTFHLSLCRVEKLFTKRHTRRMAGRISAPAVLPLAKASDSFPILPLVRFGSHHDDGPLFSCYKHVLSMEVTQLQDPIQTMLRDQASNAFFDSKLYARLSIFFYNGYAKSVDSFVSAHTNCTFYMRITHVPASCIFPYQRDKNSWFDQDAVSPYVVCIGNRSNIRTAATSERLTFEADDLSISIVAVTTKAATTADNVPGAVFMRNNEPECVIDKKSVPSYIQSKDAVVFGALQVWKRMHHAEALRRTKEVTTRREHYEQATSQEALTSPISNRKRATSSEDARDLQGRVALETTVRNSDAWGTVIERPAKRARTAEDEVGATTSTVAERQLPRPVRRTTLSDLGYDKLTDVVDIYMTHRNTPPEAQVSKFPSVTVVGVILAFSQPCRTKTNQWMLSVSLVDQSIPVVDKDDEGIEKLIVMNVNIFRKYRQELPSLRKVGDLLRLHDAGIQQYHGDMQILGRSACKMHVIRREPTHFHFDGEDINFGLDETDLFTNLWEWGQERLATQATMKRSLRFKLSEGGSMEEAGDSTVMICGMHETPPLPNRQLPRGFIRVWDGTGSPLSDPLPDESAAALATIQNGDPPREALIALHATVEELNSSSHRKGAFKQLHEIVSVRGCVVNVAVWEEPHWEFVKQNCKVGDFLRIRNVNKGSLDSGLICLMALAKSWLIPIPRQTLEVRQLAEAHQLRVERNDVPNPNSGLLPLNLSDPLLRNPVASIEEAATEVPKDGTNVAAVPRLSSIEELLLPKHALADCISGDCGGIYECRFTIVQLLPECTDGDLSKLCKRRRSHPNGGGKASYRFAVTIRDDSTITALVVSNDVGNDLLGLCAEDALAGKQRCGAAICDRLWNGRIECRVHNGETYFFVKAIGRVEE